jgi:hypothetical protein
MSLPSPTDTPGDASSAPPVFIRGVAHALPPGERLLWQGAPEHALVARHVFHRSLVIGYFAFVTGWWVVGTYGTVAMDAFLPMLGMRLGLAAIVIGTFEFLARTIAKTTIYAITSKRLVLKIGMVLPMSINVPFSVLHNAAVGRFRDGTGQIALTLVPGNRLAYVALWPHCRVFNVTQPQPVLRGLADPDAVAALLRDAVVADATDRAEAIEVGASTGDASAAAGAVLQPS